MCEPGALPQARTVFPQHTEWRPPHRFAGCGATGHGGCRSEKCGNFLFSFVYSFGPFSYFSWTQNLSAGSLLRVTPERVLIIPCNCSSYTYLHSPNHLSSFSYLFLEEEVRFSNFPEGEKGQLRPPGNPLIGSSAPVPPPHTGLQPIYSIFLKLLWQLSLLLCIM